MAARIVSMHHVKAAPHRTDNADGQSFLPGSVTQRRTSPRQQKRFMSARKQTAMQPKCLPLTATHLASGIEVQNLHLALAYLRKV
jgi:hypothetical protein